MAAPAEPRRRWLRWALIGSLALNLLLVGLIAGAILRGPPDRISGGPGLWRYAHALPDPYRRDLIRSVRRSRDAWSGPRTELRGKREELAAALRADPFEIDAVAAIFAEEQRLAGALAERGSALIVDQIARMSPDERARYAEAITRHRRPR